MSFESIQLFGKLLCSFEHGVPKSSPMQHRAYVKGMPESLHLYPRSLFSEPQKAIQKKEETIILTARPHCGNPIPIEKVDRVIVGKMIRSVLRPTMEYDAVYD